MHPTAHPATRAAESALLSLLDLTSPLRPTLTSTTPSLAPDELDYVLTFTSGAHPASRVLADLLPPDRTLLALSCRGYSPDQVLRLSSLRDLEEDEDLVLRLMLHPDLTQEAALSFFRRRASIAHDLVQGPHSALLPPFLPRLLALIDAAPLLDTAQLAAILAPTTSLSLPEWELFLRLLQDSPLPSSYYDSPESFLLAATHLASLTSLTSTPQPSPSDPS